jgi:predicted transcriptional regulator
VYYQLPNGKTVWLDISDVLNLTDQDIQYLLSINYGEYIHSPFQNSAINGHQIIDSVKTSEELEEKDVDYFYKTFFPEDFPDDSSEIDFDNLDNS